jgi:hypothetical protein
MCYLPRLNLPAAGCWYFNMGAADRDIYTVQAMVQAGPKPTIIILHAE